MLDITPCDTVCGRTFKQQQQICIEGVRATPQQKRDVCIFRCTSPDDCAASTSYVFYSLSGLASAVFAALLAALRDTDIANGYFLYLFTFICVFETLF